ncbi:MAG: DUF2812 domain-containing protein [Micrococcales bacterium]|nr:DUF2812 domain-containing protein [Micrococcales bacterium]
MTTKAPTTITRWKWTLTTLDDVERYLSRMCAEGWEPLSTSFFGSRFSFARTEPGEYVCATAATVKTSGFFAGSFDRKKYSELAALLEAQGAYVVPQGTTWDKEGVIAVRRADQGPLNICTDIDSKIADLKARLNFAGGLIATLVIVTVMLVSSIVDWPEEATLFLPTIASAMALASLASVCGLTWNVIKYSNAIRRLGRHRTTFE